MLRSEPSFVVTRRGPGSTRKIRARHNGRWGAISWRDTSKGIIPPRSLLRVGKNALFPTLRRLLESMLEVLRR
jgi:hypothetical protein